jgi:hypothetical protein
VAEKKLIATSDNLTLIYGRDFWKAVLRGKQLELGWR